jgi:hypothetical protein
VLVCRTGILWNVAIAKLERSDTKMKLLFIPVIGPVGLRIPRPISKPPSQLNETLRELPLDESNQGCNSTEAKAEAKAIPSYCLFTQFWNSLSNQLQQFGFGES